MVRKRLININQACWMLIDLAIHPKWREKCKKEIQDLLSRHLGDSLSSATLSEKLGSIPVSTWEDELPILEACLSCRAREPRQEQGGRGGTGLEGQEQFTDLLEISLVLHQVVTCSHSGGHDENELIRET